MFTLRYLQSSEGLCVTAGRFCLCGPISRRWRHVRPVTARCSRTRVSASWATVSKSCLPRSSGGPMLSATLQTSQQMCLPCPRLPWPGTGTGSQLRSLVRGGRRQDVNLVDPLTLAGPRTRGGEYVGVLFPAFGRLPTGTRMEWCRWEVGNVLPFPLSSDILLKEVCA